MRRSQRTQVLAAALAALSLTACSGGGKNATDESEPPTSAKPWATDAMQEARSLSAKLHRSHLGCKDFGEVSPADYVGYGGRNLTLPEAVARCTSLKEDVEISLLADAAAAKAWVEERRTFLCAKAADAGVLLPGFPYVLAGRGVLQPDSDPVGRKVADALAGTFDYARCSSGTGGWDDAAAATVIGFGKAIDDAGYDCANFELRDPDFTIDDFRRKGLPAPLAVGTCTGSKLTEGIQTVLSITAFSTSADRLTYITYQEKSDCALEAQSGIPVAKTVFVQVGTSLVETRWPPQAQGAAAAIGGLVVTNDTCAGG